MRHLINITFLFFTVLSYGQDSVLVRRYKPILSDRTVLESSNRQIPYKDSLTSKLYTYFGEPMNGPQYFLILKQDSLFSWDSWFGRDSYISSGAYSIVRDTLIIMGDTLNTNFFEKEYKKAKPDWPWYNKINVAKKFLLEKSPKSDSITRLILIKEKTNKQIDWDNVYLNVTDDLFSKGDLEKLKKLVTLMEEKNIKSDIINYTKQKILILEKKSE